MNVRSISALAAVAAIGAFAFAGLAGVDPVALLQAWVPHQLPTDMLLAGGMLATPVARAVHDAWETKDDGGGSDETPPGIIEIKSLIEKQGRAWEEFKRANDERLAKLAKGEAVADIEAKLAKVAKDLDQLDEVKRLYDELLVKMSRPGGLGGSGDDKDLQAEVKSFNDMLRADALVKGRDLPAPLDAQQYAQYKSAFFSLVRHGDVEKLSADERKAMSAGSDPDGGYLLPAPTVGRIVSRVYERSIMRRLATVETISTNDIEGLVDNDEAAAGWVGEADARAETATPKVGKWRIEAHEMYAEPRATQRLLDDSARDVEGWLAAKIADKFARVEGAAFWDGNGVRRPRGLAMYPTAATADESRAWGTFEHVNTGANGDFHTTKADPLQDLLGAFRDEYLQRAAWVMRREVRTRIRKMKEATSDRYLWEPSLQAGQPDRLLGYPAYVDQYMPALGTGSLSLAFGDFAEAYTIVDRIGIRTLRDPYTAKPFVKFYSTRRVGGGAVNFEAVKFLRFASS